MLYWESPSFFWGRTTNAPERGSFSISDFRLFVSPNSWRLRLSTWLTKQWEHLEVQKKVTRVKNSWVSAVVLREEERKLCIFLKKLHHRGEGYLPALRDPQNEYLMPSQWKKCPPSWPAGHFGQGRQLNFQDILPAIASFYTRLSRGTPAF